MRTCLWLLVLLSFLPLPAVGADDEAARAVLEKALVALGGAEKLARLPARSGKSRGTLMVNDSRVPVTNEWSAQGIDQLRWSSEITNDGRTSSLVMVLDGDKGWISGSGQPASPFPRESLAAIRGAVAGLRLAEDPLPLRDKAYKLAPLGELKIEGRLAVGIKVSRKGQPDLDLFFDKKTGLPVQVETRLPEDKDVEKPWTLLLGEYRTRDGLPYATRLTIRREGKVVLEMERTEVKAREKFGGDTFAKP
jgi:hypothetical protein